MQARKCTLSITTTIFQRANEILALAREKAEDVVAADVLGNAAFVTTLLPLLVSYITPLATFDPRVSLIWKIVLFYLFFDSFELFFYRAVFRFWR